MKIPPTSQLARIIQARAAKRINSTNPQPTKPTPEASTSSPTITQIPLLIRGLEPPERHCVATEDPVFDTPQAAQILGLKVDRLTKWRQRGQGPEYLKYESNRSVRYELSSLVQFKAAHRVRPSRQPHPGRRS
jgi:hypothetical protein